MQKRLAVVLLFLVLFVCTSTAVFALTANIASRSPYVFPVTNNKPIVLTIPPNIPDAERAELTVRLTESLSAAQTQRTIRSFSERDGVFTIATDGLPPGSRIIVENGGVTVQEGPRGYLVEFTTPASESAAAKKLPAPLVTEKKLLQEQDTALPAIREAVRLERQAAARGAAKKPLFLGVFPRKTTPIPTTAVEPKRRFTRVINAMELDVTFAEAEAIKKLPSVKHVYPNTKVHATLQTNVPLTGALSAWSLNDSGNACSGNVSCLLGSGVTIGIIDTGIDYTHPDVGNCTTQSFLASTCVKVSGGWNSVAGTNNPLDDHGHGTHVAATAAGCTGDDFIYEPAQGEYWGVAPNATLRAYKVLDAYGSGSLADVVDGIERAVADNVDIISMSLGGSGGPDDAISVAVDAAVEAGVVAVIAAGNEGAPETIGQPGAARKAITVAAGDGNSSIAYFSSRGPVYGSEGLIVKPDITAPGVDICAASINDSFPGYECGTNRYNISGTSMATPMVSGAAALILERYPASTPAEIKGRLLQNTYDLGEGIFDQGWGFINVTRSVQAPIVFAEPLLFANGTTETQILFFTSNATETVTLTFTTTTLQNADGGTFANLSVMPSTVTIEPNTTQAVNVSINLSASTAGFLWGYVVANTSNTTVKNLVTVNRYAYLNISSDEGIYPDFMFLNPSLNNTKYVWSDYSGDPALFSFEGSNYTIVAYNFIYDPTQMYWYPNDRLFAIAYNVSLTPGTVSNLTVSMTNTTPISFSRRDRRGTPLTLNYDRMMLSFHGGSLGMCSSSWTAGTCLAPTPGRLCEWSGYSCYDLNPGSITFGAYSTNPGESVVYFGNFSLGSIVTDFLYTVGGTS